MEPSGSAQLCCLLAVMGHTELFLRQIEGLRHKQLARLGSTLGRREIAAGCSGIPLPWSHPLPDPAVWGSPPRRGLGAVHSQGDVLEPGRRDSFHSGCLKGFLVADAGSLHCAILGCGSPSALPAQQELLLCVPPRCVWGGWEGTGKGYWYILARQAKVCSWQDSRAGKRHPCVLRKKMLKGIS